MIWIFPNEEMKMDFSSFSLQDPKIPGFRENERRGIEGFDDQIDLRLIDESIIEDQSPEWGKEWTV